MKAKYKRLRQFSLLLMFLIAMGFGPGSADVLGADDFADGDGTEAAPYLVSTAQELNNVRSHLDAHFRQVADIDLSGFNAGEGWEPIGFFDEHERAFFTGVYDGNGYTIVNLTIHDSARGQVGLFGVTYDAVLENISLQSADVEGAEFVGILVGIQFLGSIIECHVDGKAEGYHVGGLAGLNYGGVIADSSSTVEVHGTELIGGLVGANVLCDEDIDGEKMEDPEPGIIRNSSVEGFVSGTTGSAKAGGLVGFNGEGGLILSCQTDVNVEAISFAAGGIAAVNGDGGLIVDSFVAKGSSVQAVFAGGVVGMNTQAEVEACYSQAQVSSIAGGVGGGVVGFNQNGGSVVKCYADNTVTGRYVGGIAGANLGSITESYATGKIEADADEDSIVGGIVGLNGLRNYENGDVAGQVADCFSAALLSGSVQGSLIGTQGADIQSGFDWNTDPNDGPFFIDIDKGLVDLGELGNSYWNSDMHNAGVGYGDNSGAKGRTTTQMTDYEAEPDPYPEAYADWDFENTWESTYWNSDLDGNFGYPALLWQGMADRLETVGAEDIGYDSATLIGRTRSTLDMDNFFHFREQGQEDWRQTGNTWTSKPTLFSRQAIGLLPATTYEFKAIQIWYLNFFGTHEVKTEAEILTFTTPWAIQVGEPQGEGETDPAEGVHQYPVGESTVVTATPAHNWNFSHWLINDEHIDTDNPITVTCDGCKQLIFLKPVFQEKTTYSGITYNWLEEHDLPTDGSVDHQDLENKGMTVLEDYIADTDPHDANSVFVIERIEKMDKVEIHYIPDSIRRKYTLWSSEDLKYWEPVTDQESVPGGDAPLLDYPSANDSKRFYRVEVEVD